MTSEMTQTYAVLIANRPFWQRLAWSAGSPEQAEDGCQAWLDAGQGAALGDCDDTQATAEDMPCGDYCVVPGRTVGGQDELPLGIVDGTLLDSGGNG